MLQCWRDGKWEDPVEGDVVESVDSNFAIQRAVVEIGPSWCNSRR